MKYLFIIALSFSLVSPALAAKTVKGSVPKLAPLQPIPGGVLPNYSKNIQYQDSSHAGNPVPVNSGQNSQNNQSLNPSSAASQNPASFNYIRWLAALLAVAVIGFLVYKRSKAK